MKQLLQGGKGFKCSLLGNEAIARGALEAGVKFVSCYPGTPSSEVVDTLYALKKADCGADYHLEYSVNEKVAMEIACGAALGGARSLATMKHVGMNVAADPMFTAAYTGLPGGLVVISGDDPGCHSSQNEQDNREYARFASLPCFEPVSAQEAKDMTAAAFKLAAGLQQPVMLRTTTRISHMRSPVVFDEINAAPLVEFERNPGRYVPVPAVARKRHAALREQMRKAAEFANKSSFNKVAWPEEKPEGEKPVGIVASGVARAYLADALLLTGLKGRAAVLELGMTWPLPEDLLLEFLNDCSRILVMEEGEPLLEKDIRALAQKHGLKVDIAGKDAGLGTTGEYSTTLVKDRLERWLNLQNTTRNNIQPLNLPGRPPNLCPGCAHRSVYYAVRKVFGNDAIYSSDIGCYTLGLLPPLRMADFLVCMGSSITAGSGFVRASGKTTVAFIGDSTFFHSGLTGLANAVFNNHNLLVVILDNGTTAMTGHQPNPGMEQENLDSGATRLNMEKIVAGLGIDKCMTVKAGNLASMLDALRELRYLDGTRVLIAREPCSLYARHRQKKKKTRVAVVKKQSDSAEACARELACPAFTRKEGNLEVDKNLCGGCMLCLQIAPDAFASEKF